MNGYIPLSIFDLAMASGLVLIAGGLSIANSLSIEKPLALAIARMTAQLLAVAFLIKPMFEQTSPWITLAALTVVVAAMVVEILSRITRPFRTRRDGIIASLPAFVASLLATLVALAIVQPSAWYAPRFLLPLISMVAGTALFSGALVIDTITDAAHARRREIEMRLALGATRTQAFSGILARALGIGLMPVLTLLSTAGLASLPGMMTGQVLAGVAPLEAAKYQILIMVLIAGASALSAVSAALISVHLLTDERHRLRIDVRPTAAPIALKRKPVSALQKHIARLGRARDGKR
ncbi:MAG: ABC transporter permease [Hyphomicrobium sp.]